MGISVNPCALTVILILILFSVAWTLADGAGMHQRPCHCVKLLSAEYTARLRGGHLSCIYPARRSHGCPSAVVAKLHQGLSVCLSLKEKRVRRWIAVSECSGHGKRSVRGRRRIHCCH
ncbi:uncharacterized protein LOC116951036 isoform X1 [Petromyzon marinus]|uniref:Uncharacterized protein LOC116951036 isoform X1 n=1 Tax=Petromyzon marinus TaxID=7757 RepID=A0AAJ7X8I1_PETMA|nr:uncharacterized protein LOC116951036 isoform X1 [Petromyzon marinus]